MSAGNYGVICERCLSENEPRNIMLISGSARTVSIGDEEVPVQGHLLMRNCDTCDFHLARLRENFAGQAMAALIMAHSAEREFECAEFAHNAMEHAKALIAALKGGA